MMEEFERLRKRDWALAIATIGLMTLVALFALWMLLLAP
jgi:hypothetical protein